ncbi:MbnP family protein [Winogradskyella sp. R77965]|uniref:MbnP family protein n=1 Tax=Winogradskyella sp. R77965 TaxID=3093872 RepID=UPI0037DCE364
MSKRIIALFLFATMGLTSCSEDLDDNLSLQNLTTFNFTHNWDGTLVTNANFNNFEYTNENGDLLSIERLRYVISDITFTSSNNEIIELDVYNLVDVTNNNNLSFTPQTQIPTGSYTVSFTFGLDNEDNVENYIDLNSASFNVPEMLGSGYHYMQFDGKFINSNSEEQGFNYHAIRAVDNPGTNPTFPQDTFFTVDLGMIDITSNTEIEVQMNIAEWFKNPIPWDLNDFNQMLMPNSTAQIMMYDNGQNVFSLGEVIQ